MHLLASLMIVDLPDTSCSKEHEPQSFLLAQSYVLLVLSLLVLCVSQVVCMGLHGPAYPVAFVISLLYYLYPVACVPVKPDRITEPSHRRWESKHYRVHLCSRVNDDRFQLFLLWQRANINSFSQPYSAGVREKLVSIEQCLTPTR